MVGVVLAGPTLVGLTSIPQSLLAQQLPAEAGRLTATSTNLGWTGPIRVEGLRLADPQDAVLASVDRVEIAGGLLGLLGGDTAPLRVRVEGARIDLVVGPQGTNFDAVIEALQKKSAPAQAPGIDQPAASTSARRPIEVAVENGAVLVTNAINGDAWLLDGVQARINDPALGPDAIEATVQGALAGYADGQAQSPAGDFAVRLGGDTAERRAEIKAGQVPLEILTPFLARVDPTAEVRGTLAIEGDAAWRVGASPPAGSSAAELVRRLAAGGVRSSGVVRLDAVEFAGAATQGGPIQLAKIDVPWRLAGGEDALAIQQLDLTSEVGNATATGSVSAGEVERWASGVAAAPRDLKVTGRVDFGRLARVAPQLVRLQRGARIESGRVDLSADFNAGRINATVATGPLAGVAEGRRIEWREPLDLTLQATQRTPAAGLAGWSLEQLDARSSFFQAQAAGDARQLDGDFRFDLDRLARELAPVIDLGDTRLAGTGRAQFEVTRDLTAGRWRLVGNSRVRDLLVGPPAAPLASEPDLAIDAKLTGSLQALNEPPTGTVSLQAGDDTLAATLPEPNPNGAQPFELDLRGDTARWLRRAGAVVIGLPSPEEVGLAGRVELSAKGLADAEGGRFDRFDLALNGFDLDTGGLDASTPRVRLRGERIEASGAGTWSTRDRVVQLSTGTLVSSVASAALADVRVAFDTPAESSGRVDFRANLGRLNNWLPPRQGPAQYAADGELQGSALLRGVPEGLNIKLKLDGQRLVLIDRLATAAPNQRPGPQTVWSDPRVQLDADAMVTTLAEADALIYALDLRDARVQSASVNGSFGGQVADLAALRGVELGGGVDYDLEKLAPLLWPTVGDGVRLVGRDRATFRLETDESAPADAAPISRLRATVAAPWESADLFGLPVGAGRLSANLAGGVVRVDPLDVSIGGGRLTTAANATLDPAPATLAIRPGPLVTDVAMSQEVTERVLKFIAPVLADATRIEGRFSLNLSELVVPLTPPPGGGPPPVRAAGVLDIHQVLVRPGPSVAEWVGVVRQIAALAKDGVQSVAQPSDSVLVRIDNSAVAFQMVDGRVYHRGLRFNVGDAVVESSGSVGVDETLNLVLAVPILDEWVAKEPTLLGRLRGQALRIPIQGTLNKPKINRDAFKELSGRVLESAAAGAVESGLNKLFEKLRSR